MGNLVARIQGIPFQSIQQNLSWKLSILKNILKKIHTRDFDREMIFPFFPFVVVIEL